MAYDFPTNPTEDQEYVPPVGGQTYIYRAPRWLVKGVPPAGSAAPTGIDEAPLDGTQYGREDGAWTAVVIPTHDWATLSGKPATFPPTLPIPWSDISSKPATFPPALPILWTDVSGKPATYPPNLPIPWTDVSGKPATYPPTLPITMANVTGLDAAQLAQDNAIAIKLDAGDYNAADVLAKVKSQDGTGSGLDADLLDGQESAYFLDYSHFTNLPATFPPTLPIAWTNVSGKPTTFPPTLPIAQSDVTNLTGDLAAKEPRITAGTIAQYWRGDKSWQPLPPPGITEAPIDGNIYGRKDASWILGGGYLPSGVVIADAAPATPIVGQLWFESDTGNTYIWYDDGNSRQWIHVSGFSAYSSGAGGGISEAPVDGNNYARRNTAWVNMGTSVQVPEAPMDGKQYVRTNGAWVELVIPPPVATPFMFDVNGDAIVKFSATTVVRIKSTGLILTKDDIEVFSVSV